MYIPKSYEQNDLNELYNFIEANNFGMLISQVDDAPFATHLPFLLKRAETPSDAVLVSHMARANPHWKAITPETKVLVIFHGAHHFISANWYVQSSVPTWNYMVAHVYGTVELIHSTEDLLSMVTEIADYHETAFETYWTIDGLTPERREILLQSIVGIHLRIERIEGKYKLNQNRGVEDQQGVIDALAQYDYSDAQIIREQMRRNLED